jgi:predicted RecB family nuclease
LFLDVHEDQAKRDPESRFVQLLWEKGTAYEKEVMDGLQIPFSDFSALEDDVREQLTSQAMARGDGLIYGGRIRCCDLLGEPDLLLRMERGYAAGDIKSGSGLKDGSGDQPGQRPKKHYALQLSQYTDILERMGVSAGRHPFIWDIHGRKIYYDLDIQTGPGTGNTLWKLYRDSLEQARRIVSLKESTLPAYSSGTCKLCHWNSLCKQQLRTLDDLTLIPELGRKRRDAMYPRIKSVRQFALTDPATLMSGKKTVFEGINASTLKKFHTRACLIADVQARPVIKKLPHLPERDKELFFDIETDPMRDICYLHGFVERTSRDRSTERYMAFLAETPDQDGERRAFASAWEYVRSSFPCTLFFYSRYEHTWWRRLQKRYPDIASEQQIKEMFDSHIAVDLYYGVVVPCTHWPTMDHSIKTLATFLGFGWRDQSPSGADSIEWYHRWIETGDPAIRKRILEYNEDDCTATRVVLDGIRSLCEET